MNNNLTTNTSPNYHYYEANINWAMAVAIVGSVAFIGKYVRDIVVIVLNSNKNIELAPKDNTLKISSQVVPAQP